MSRMNSTRSGCKDVFHAFMVKNAHYEGVLEIPGISPETEYPEKLIPFSKTIGASDPDAWVHFYEDDASFERLWNTPFKYLPILKRYKGVISPDFSLYRDMPLIMQYWNIYRSHAVAVWLQDNGIKVIPNVRWADDRTYEICCAGVPKHATIAVGAHGCIKLLREREYFIRGLEYVVSVLKPETIVVYGTMPNTVFEKYRKNGIRLLRFESECMRAHRKAVNA